MPRWLSGFQPNCTRSDRCILTDCSKHKNRGSGPGCNRGTAARDSRIGFASRDRLHSCYLPQPLPRKNGEAASLNILIKPKLSTGYKTALTEAMMNRVSICGCSTCFRFRFPAQKQQTIRSLPIDNGAFAGCLRHLLQSHNCRQ